MSFILNANDKILVVAPHPDDESIGCGGLLASYRGHCDVLLVTDGFREDLNNTEISEQRVLEFKNATDCLGTCERFTLHIPEQKIPEYFDRIMSVDFSKYKYILVPNRYEEHKDHIDVYKSIKKAIKKQSVKTELIEYEVWTTIRKPNIKLDISNVVEAKKAAIEYHSSQISDLDYVGMILGLNSYRGKGHGCDYAEVFYSAARYRQKKKKNIKRVIKSFLRR